MSPTAERPSIIYDLAIIGGGIAGAGIARDAALRGIRTVLFEKNTFGSGTSSKSSKLIHGGIRYLEIAWDFLKKGRVKEAWKNFRFVFLALRETHILAKTAPDLVKPFSLIIPIYKNGSRRPWSVYLGGLLYSFMASLSGASSFVRILAKPESVLQRVPALQKEGLQGGIMIWDHWTDDVKLAKAVISSAQKSGAGIFEHAEVMAYRWDDSKKVYAVELRMENRQRTFLARKLVNASGAWVDQTRQRGGEAGENLIVPVAGCHIHLKQFSPYSVILQAEDKRVFFVINFHNVARVGTTERIETNPDHAEATEEEVNYLLRELARYFPNLKAGKEDILSTDAGIRPLARPKKADSPNTISREHEIRTGPSGVLHVLGVKLTDHRRAAEEIVDKLVPDLARQNPAIKTRSLTRTQPL